MRGVVVLFLLVAGAFMVTTQVVAQVAWPAVKKLVTTSFPDVDQLSTDGLHTWMQDSTRVQPVIFDVREPAEYAMSHLPTAERLNPEMDTKNDLPASLTTLDKDAPIVLYCSVGYRSSKLAHQLQREGFTNVQNLEGSIFQWANEGKPIVLDGEPATVVHPYDAVWGKLLDEAVRGDI